MSAAPYPPGCAYCWTCPACGCTLADAYEEAKRERDETRALFVQCSETLTAALQERAELMEAFGDVLRGLDAMGAQHVAIERARAAIRRFGGR